MPRYEKLLVRCGLSRVQYAVMYRCASARAQRAHWFTRSQTKRLRLSKILAQHNENITGPYEKYNSQHRCGTKMACGPLS